ncbi:uncharacterized protein METZ01_LOCUS309400, partial [marine metagenome]
VNRIQKIFHIKTNKIIPYITAGFPSMKDTHGLIIAAENAGAAMVELGM